MMNDTKVDEVRYRTEHERIFKSRLKGFQVEAINLRRGFEVSMAVNVFGVGRVLPNSLPRVGRKNEKSGFHSEGAHVRHANLHA